MFVYTVDYVTVKRGEYIDIAESLRRFPTQKRSIYINLTNRCTCACTFCLRSLKEMSEEMSLWLKEEPSVDMIKKELQQVPWELVEEVVFCGFGEPTMRLDEILELLKYLKESHPQIKTRLNTNGLSDLYYQRDTAVSFKDSGLDTISISLNASNAERYLELTRSRFGIKSFDAMLHFAVECKKYIKNVILSIVDQVEDQEEIRLCQKICDEHKLTLRVRPFEAN